MKAGYFWFCLVSQLTGIQEITRLEFAAVFLMRTSKVWIYFCEHTEKLGILRQTFASQTVTHRVLNKIWK